MVSVIMPTYNCASFISDSIESVIAQSMDDWEIQIVDDCSTDNTREVINPFIQQYPQIHYTCLAENRGPNIARTEAIRRATGKYIAFLDSDDLWLPDKLEKQITFMQQNNAVFSCTAYEQMDEKGNILSKVLYPPVKTDYKKMLHLADPIGNLTVIYDQSALGKYEVPDIRKRNDYALWLKILHDTEYCMGLQDVLARYRVRESSVSSKKLQLVKYHWELYHRIEKLGIFRSIFYICCWVIVKGMGIGTKEKRSK